MLRGDLRAEDDGADWASQAERLLEAASPQLILLAPALLVDAWLQARDRRATAA